MKVTVLAAWHCCQATFLMLVEGSPKTGGSPAAKKGPAHIPSVFMDFSAQLPCAAVFNSKLAMGEKTKILYYSSFSNVFFSFPLG